MNAVDRNRVFERTAAEAAASGKRPRLLLHACCAPCATSVLERLSAFDVTVWFYNPNLFPAEEYARRAGEFGKLCAAEIEPYDPAPFEAAAAGLEDEPEGGKRCEKCFELRLSRAVLRAKAGAFDFVSTTLTVSPHKDAERVNAIGARLAAEAGGAVWLEADFKKRDGYVRSVALSREFGLYRQNYCGCRFSLRKDG